MGFIMKRILFIIIFLLILFSCVKEHTYINKGIKFYYYEIEAYVYIFNIDNGIIRNIIPDDFEVDKIVKGKIFIKKYKKAHLPESGGNFIEAGIFILVEHEKNKAWYLLESYVDIPLKAFAPYRKCGYINKYSMINYKPAGSHFRATVKRKFKLVLELEFSFLPTEKFNLTKELEYLHELPIITTEKAKPVIIETIDKVKPETAFKEGIGAFVFHENAPDNLKLLNKSKVKKVYFYEKKGKETIRAYYAN
jgi:hypothetical protein